LLGLGLAVLGCMAWAQEPSRASVTLNIEPQALGDALTKFAEQSGLQVLLFAEVSEGIRTPRVSGSYEPQEALKVLLEKTGLEYEYINERTVAIRVKGVGDGVRKGAADAGMRKERGEAGMQVAEGEESGDQGSTGGGGRYYG